MGQQIVVAGLGWFGATLARALTEAGHDVLGVDSREDPVRDLVETISKAVQGDATSRALWDDLQAKGADIGIVAFREEAHNVHTALLMRKLGLKRVVARSDSEPHSEILRAIGVESIVEPSRESALRLAHTLGVSIMDYLEVSEDFGIAKIMASAQLKGLTVRKLFDERRATVLVLRRGGRLVLEPRDDDEIREGDLLIIAGKDQDLRELGGVGVAKSESERAKTA
ncbi:MAG: TrkA family potassium uptake protein [Chloroflexi bacterium]|nr:TrkA family potassium uptake protein [Chloroflexota bacterium]